MNRSTLYTLVSAFPVLLPALLSAQVAIGEWREHFPFRQTFNVTEGGGKAWCASQTAIFSFDPATYEFERLSKVNRLNDVGIRSMRWNTTLGMLVVGYDNGNLDLVSAGSTYNLSDIKRSSILGDKGINHIRFEGTLAYLSCGFGVVVVDLFAKEISDTWLIGPGGSQLIINATEVHGDSVYAATESGLYAALHDSPNLAAFTNWHKNPAVPVPNGEYSGVLSFSNRLLANYRSPLTDADTLYTYDGAWQKLAGIDPQITNLSLEKNIAGDRLVIAHRFHIQMFDGTLTEVNAQYGYGPQTPFPATAIPSENGHFWIADRENGLVRGYGNSNGEMLYPNGPSRTSAIGMSASGGSLFVASGSVATNWSNNFRKDGVHHFQNGEWRTTSNENDALMATGANTYGGAVNDIMAVAVDPKDPNHAYAGSWDDGVLEFTNRQLTSIYNQDNSNGALQIFSPLGGANAVLIGGLAFDTDGNLWVSNANVTNPIVVRKANGTWKSFNPGTVLNNQTLLGSIVPATNGYKWFVRPRGNGILVFSDGGTIDNTSDDQYKVLNNFEGSGGLPTTDVLDIAEDLDGEIWVGTGKGVAVFYNPDAIFTNSDFDAQQILIEQDGNVQILLETEVVTCVTVDAANRKWLGTVSSGAYLVSADGTVQQQHFTTENSPLPSNNVTDIAIDEVTGDVFIATDRGIVSYRGDAIGSAVEADCAKVYPNPVRANHAGPVAITGLVRDSEVKITDMSGNLVYRTTSLGGQAMWPGTDMSGNRVSSGVYLAFSSNGDGSQKCMTKVLVMR